MFQNANLQKNVNPYQSVNYRITNFGIKIVKKSDLKLCKIKI